MPHLDAKALTDDPKGMEFLASVLDLPADSPTLAFGEVEPVRMVDTAPETAQIMPPRMRKNMVPEAA